MVTKKIVWDKLARASLKEAYNYIKRDSVLQAEKVRDVIIAACNKLSSRPEIHPPDKYRKDKDVRFRTFIKYNYRISYFITEDTIRVIRLRHVKQEPKEY
jgi:plasmid stabilization system protein ParE